MSGEILINSSLVTHNGYRESYEFVLDDKMHVIECIKVDPTAQTMITPIFNVNEELDGLLFELNHVRVNPRVDNSYIISCLTRALNDIGVKVKNQTPQDPKSPAFRPLGEISDNVRFYLTNTQVIFLSPAIRPKVIKSDQPNNKDYI